MLTFALLLTASIAAFQPSTTIVLGSLERDLTGDKQPEILRVVGVGPTRDNLDVTFTIESAGKTIDRFKLAPLTRTVGFDAGRHVVSADEQRSRIKEFGRWFFAKDKLSDQRISVTAFAVRLQAKWLRFLMSLNATDNRLTQPLAT